MAAVSMKASITLIAGVCAVLLSLVVLVREFPVLGYGGQESLSTTVALAQDRLAPAYSFYGHKRLMSACIWGMTGVWQAVAPGGERVAHAQTCLDHALSYASHTTIDSLTWVVAARASYVLGDQEALNKYLDYARRAGPNEQWVAALRVSLAEDAMSLLDAENGENHRSDLTLMVMSRSGIAAIAGRYWSDEDFRERITSVVEQMSNDDKRRFISSVRRVSQGSVP
ncbi:hypothetical protein H6M51_23755 [Rhizobium sp. AQ_MP]|uniref:hypothetical protein n=1 Tax=Rhizobium sp. AQ_MP TaxID=2761536 RepID=UPI001639EFFF|nr:hypothetical protein [Rhizobium sp. AQ_MP]MBC2775876.1 hypothetical protein [Rhizobium sp. AQ_MP]